MTTSSPPPRDARCATPALAPAAAWSTVCPYASASVRHCRSVAALLAARSTRRRQAGSARRRPAGTSASSWPPGAARSSSPGACHTLVHARVARRNTASLRSWVRTWRNVPRVCSGRSRPARLRDELAQPSATWVLLDARGCRSVVAPCTLRRGPRAEAPARSSQLEQNAATAATIGGGQRRAGPAAPSARASSSSHCH